jgi:hypothetical protein
MFIPLLTVLGIALTAICAGLFLSAKVQAPQKQEISYSERGATSRRGRDRAYIVRRETLQGNVGATTARERRYAFAAVEKRSWADVLASFNMGSMFRGSAAGKPTPWGGVILILLALFGFSMFMLHTLMLNPVSFLNLSASGVSPLQATTHQDQAPASPFASLSGASKALIRVNQLDPAQYANPKDYKNWAYSTCSAAAMTETINAYGHTYRIADILKVESGIGEITPDLGLLEPHGIDRTVAHFGFKTVWMSNTGLDHVISVANTGHPVIVSFPPSRWAGGHILIVRGGDSQNVYLADSSKLNMQVMSRSMFLKYWEGFAVAAVPSK